MRIPRRSPSAAGQPFGFYFPLLCLGRVTFQPSTMIRTTRNYVILSGKFFARYSGARKH